MTGILPAGQIFAVENNKNNIVSDNDAEISDNIIEVSGTDAEPSENITSVSNDLEELSSGLYESTASGNAAVSDDLLELVASDIPFGAYDDNTYVENPEPLDEFITPVTNSEDAVSGLFSEEAAGTSYAVSYNDAVEGLMPNETRNQGNSSLCWAFSTSLLAEVSMIKNKLAGRDVHYSEDQIGYFFFHRVADPLGGTAGDLNTIKGSTTYYYRGGNNIYNSWSLASWIAVRDQEDLPFKNSAYSDVSSDKAYNSTAHLQDFYWASTSSSGTDISYIENVKELIYNYGAVSMIVYSGTAINGYHAAYNTTAGGGHNISIVGWDDNFSASKFTTTPPGDGAWYIRDNYGTNGNRDENGCYWMSYYDKSIRRSSSKAIAFTFEKGDNYDNNYQYDGSCASTTFGWQNSKGITAANVYTAVSDETLEAVGYAPASSEMDYTIRIYKLSSANDAPNSGQEVTEAQTSGSTRYYGYRTIPLKSSVSLSAGQAYSVVVEAECTADDETGRLGVECYQNADDWVSFTATTSENQSYVKYGSTWYDMNSYNNKNRAFRIKAYTNDEKDMRASYEMLDSDSYTYDGSEHKVSVNVVSSNGQVMTKGIDYNVTYLNNIYPGKAVVSVNSLNGKSLSNRYFSFDIAARSIEGDFVESIPDQTYTGSELLPDIVLYDSGIGVYLSEGTDYYMERSDSVSAGSVTVSINGIGKYTDSIETSYIIRPKQADFSITGVTDQIYTSKPITLSFDVVDPVLGDVEEGSDYTVSYQDNVNAGTAWLVLTGSGNYTGTVKKAFTIKPKSTDCFDIADIPTEKYTGKAVCPEIVIKDRDLDSVLVKNRDYTVSYNNNVNEGTASVSICAIGNYSGELERTFIISGAEKLDLKIKKIADQQFKPGMEDYCPSLKVKYNNWTLLEGRDYYTVYENNDAAGNAHVTVRGLVGTIYDTSGVSADFVIKAYPIKKASIEGIADRIYYEGRDYSKDGISLDLKMKSAIDGKMIPLEEGTDYRIVFDEKTKIPSKAGKKVYFYIEGMGNYSGSIKKYFTVRSYIPIANEDYFDISISQDEFVYNGKAHKPDVTVVYKNPYGGSDITLEKGSDYKVSYAANKSAGRGRAIVKPTQSFKNKYNVKGRTTVYFTIKGKEIHGCAYRMNNEFVYNAKARKPSVTMYLPNGNRLGKSNYYVVYENNIKAGTAYFIVYGKNNYAGVILSGEFYIRPRSFKKTSLSYKYNRSTGEFDRFYVRYNGSTLRENVDYTVNDSEPDSKGKVTRTATPISGRNFLDDAVKKFKYKK